MQFCSSTGIFEPHKDGPASACLGAGPSCPSHSAGTWRQAARLEGGAVADASLPIGDIIAVARAAWTAYDIRATRLEFRRGLESCLDNTVPEMKRRVRESAMDRIHSILADQHR